MTKGDQCFRIAPHVGRRNLAIGTVSPWLISRFGWCAGEVSEIAASSSDFRQSLLQFTPKQFHLLGLSFALMRRSSVRGEIDIADFGELLASAPGKEVIARIYGRVPAGILRCLGKLPDRLLRPGAYVDLINLLEEPRAAKVLFHSDSINSNTIALLTRLDPALRKPRLISLLRVPRAAAILEFLVEVVLRIRSDASRDAVLQSLGLVGSVESLEKWFCSWVEKAEFPSPPWDGSDILMPLRTMGEMREAARSMRNCLQGKVVSVISGAKYYYLRRADPFVVVELVNDRLAGWILTEMKGLENKPVPVRLAAGIRDEFKAAGIGSLPVFEGMPRGINPLYWFSADFHWPHV